MKFQEMLLKLTLNNSMFDKLAALINVKQGKWYAQILCTPTPVDLTGL